MEYFSKIYALMGNQRKIRKWRHSMQYFCCYFSSDNIITALVTDWQPSHHRQPSSLLNLNCLPGLEKIPPISQGLVTLLHICGVIPTLQLLETPQQKPISPHRAPVPIAEKKPLSAPVPIALILSHRTASVSQCFKSFMIFYMWFTMFYVCFTMFSELRHYRHRSLHYLQSPHQSTWPPITTGISDNAIKVIPC